MIKVVNGVPTREPVPKFLIGLQPGSLSDLSWTDPALGLREVVWWPEVNQSLPLGMYQKYGDEILTVDHDNKVVVSACEVLDMTEEEIIAAAPQSCTVLQGLLAVDQSGLTAAYQSWADSPDRTFTDRIFIHRTLTWRRDNPVLIAGATALGLSPLNVAYLFVLANTIGE